MLHENTRLETLWERPPENSQQQYVSTLIIILMSKTSPRASFALFALGNIDIIVMLFDHVPLNSLIQTSEISCLRDCMSSHGCVFAMIIHHNCFST